MPYLAMPHDVQLESIAILILFRNAAPTLRVKFNVHPWLGFSSDA